jgi:hypothetical protein
VLWVYSDDEVDFEVRRERKKEKFQSLLSFWVGWFYLPTYSTNFRKSPVTLTLVGIHATSSPITTITKCLPGHPVPCSAS